MLGEAKVTTDASAATTSFTLIDGASLRFTVEEEEMLVVLEFQANTTHDTTNGLSDFTFFVDDADVADLTNGIIRHGHGVIGIDQSLVMRKVLRLSKGEHRVELRAKAPAGAVQIEGAGWPASLTARRISAQGTLAHGVDAKAQGIF